MIHGPYKVDNKTFWIFSDKPVCVGYDPVIDEWERLSRNWPWENLMTRFDKISMDVPHLYYDIEVYAKEGLPKYFDKPIVSIAYITCDGKKDVIMHEDERRILEEFREVALKYPVIVGWNSSKFDYPYIMTRAISIGVDLSHVVDIDEMVLYKELFKRKGVHSYKLDDVASFETGKPLRKIDINLRELDYNSPEELRRLAEYNLHDVELLKEIDDTLHLVKLTKNIAETTLTPLNILVDKHFKYSRAVGTMILKISRKHGIVPPKRNYNIENFYIKGGIVFDPPVGVFKNVACLDFAGAYPRIISEFNISFNTIRFKPEKNTVRLLAEIQDNNFVPVWFKQDILGPMAEAVRRLMQLKKYYTELRDREKPGTKKYSDYHELRHAVKYVLNSFYGATAYKYFRFFDPLVANTITTTQRLLVLKSKSIAESLGMRVLYGDTDSIFVELKGDVQDLLDKLYEGLSSFVKETFGVPKRVFDIDVNYIANKMLFSGKKKRYAAHVVVEEGRPCDYIKIKGYDCIQGHIPEIARKLQRGMIERILKGEDPVSIFSDTIIRVIKGEVGFEEVAIRMSYNGEYKYNVPQKVAAELYRKHGQEVWPGDKVFFLRTPKNVYVEMNFDPNAYDVKYTIIDKLLAVTEAITGKDYRRGFTYTKWENVLLERLEAIGKDLRELYRQAIN